MAVYKRDLVDINLETGNIHRSFLKHSIGYKDAAADHFGIRVFRNGEPVSLTGVSVQGIFMPPQGSPIAITSGNIVSENEAEVVLPQACYNYDGQFTLSIKLVDATNAVTGTMRIVDGMVDNTHASGTVAPTDTVPTYQEILAVYAQLLEDVTDYESVVATQDAKIDDLKSALNDSIEKLFGAEIIPLTQGAYVAVNPSPLSFTPVSNSLFSYAVVECQAGDIFTINGLGGGSYQTSLYAFAKANGQRLLISSTNQLAYREVIVAPTDAERLVINIKNATDFCYKGIPDYPDLISDEIEGSITSYDFTNISEKIFTKRFVKGNTYTLTNGTTKKSGRVYLYRANGTYLDTIGQINAGASYTFTATENYLAIRLYSEGTGSFTLADNGIVKAINDSFDNALTLTGNGFELSYGTISATGAQENADDRIRTSFIPVLKGDITRSNVAGNLFTVKYYDKNKVFVNGTDWTHNNYVSEIDGFVRYVFRKSGDVTIDPADFDTLSHYVNLVRYVPGLYNVVFDDSIQTLNPEAESAIVSAASRQNNYGYSDKKIYPQVLVCTDIHRDWTRLNRAFAYNDDCITSSLTLCLGDIAEVPNDLSNYDWSAKVLACSKPILPIVGNHDMSVLNSGGMKTNAWLMEYLYSSSLQTHNGEVHDDDSLYWYKDITKTYTDRGGSHTKTLRIIAINQFEYPSDATDARSYIFYSQDEIDWFINLLDNIPADTYVMIITHECPTKTAKVQSSIWSQESRVGNNVAYEDADSQDDPDMLLKIVKAWIDGGTVSLTNEQVLSGITETITVNHTFASAHEGKFAGWVCGHSHHDAYALRAGYENQKIIVLNCTCCYDYQQNSDIGRMENGKPQDCITMVSYDWDADKIRLVRLGADTTINGVLRRMVVI